MDAGIIFIILVIIVSVISSTSKGTRRRQLEQALYNYFRQNGFQSKRVWTTQGLYGWYIMGYFRRQAIVIKSRLEEKDSGLTINKIVIQLDIADNYYLRLRPRKSWSAFDVETQCWTDDLNFDRAFTLSSSPALFAGSVFGPRPTLRQTLMESLPPEIMKMPDYILEVKGTQLIFSKHKVWTVDQLDALLKLLCDLAVAIEETAAYLFQFEAEPIPDSALN